MADKLFNNKNNKTASTIQLEQPSEPPAEVDAVSATASELPSEFPPSKVAKKPVQTSGSGGNKNNNNNMLLMLSTSLLVIVISAIVAFFYNKQ
jgi:uncharacterized protein (UPF0333 family)